MADFSIPPDGWTGETVESWVVYCPVDVIAKVVGGVGGLVPGQLAVWPIGGSPPAPVIRAVIRDAYAATPVLAFHPSADPAGTVDIPMIVRHPTALFVDATAWAPVSATASIPPLSVTTTARPVEATWSGGDDPSSITCDGPGVPIDLSADWEDQDLSCSMMFLHGSSVEDYELAVSVVWEVTYTCSAFCVGGNLPPLVTNSVRPVRVAEIRSVVTSFGGGGDD